MRLKIRQLLYIFLALAAFALLIIVVTHSQSPETLMNPPEASGAYKDIKKVIENSIDEDVILKAPNEGAYTTAITFTDLNNDGENEAIAFYRKKSDDTSAIYLSVLIKDGSKWHASESLKGKGNDVLEFSFGDLNYDSTPEIVVGWNMFDSKDNNSLCVYSVKVEKEKLQIKENAALVYTKMFVDDVCHDGKKEILLIKNSFQDDTGEATASVLELEDEKLKTVATAKLIKSVSEYKKLQTRLISGNTVFYLDGVINDTEMITEILYWDEQSKTLVNPVFNDDEIITHRKALVCSGDINNDTIIEIPCSETQNDGGVEICKWKQFELDGFRTICRGVCSQDLTFIFPDKWNDAITVRAENNSWSFFDVSSGEEEKLFTVVKCDLSSWKQFSADYEKIKIYYGTIYAVKMHNTKSDLALSKAEIKTAIIDNI